MGFFKEAYDLSPQFSDVRVYYAMSAIYNGQLGLVDEIISTPEDKSAFAFNQHAIQAVYQAKMYPRLIEMFNLQIEKAPQDTQARTNLAYILNESGNPKKAVEVLTQAGVDIPTFKEQADGFIASITAESQATVEINGQTVPVNVPGQ
jgi:thioredoxin-like negative regulator of GroEL